MKKVSEVGHPRPDIKINAVLEHWHTKGRRETILLTVDEDDVSYRFEDGAELSYDWDVIEWKVIKWILV